MHKNQNAGSRNGKVGFAGLMATLLLSLALTSVAQAKPFYTFHNSLAGVAITDCQVGHDFMTKNFPLWVDDGQREWKVERTGIGFFSYFFIEGCELYTNSISLRIVLTAIGIPQVVGYVCTEQDAM
jgi:hypothetical protein